MMARNLLLRGISCLKRRYEMLKKAVAILGSLAVIGVGVSLAQTPGQAKKKAEARNRAQVRSEYRLQFVDENGDGINDLLRDYDGDGIPNCQDPDWVPPEDGTGYQGGNGNGGKGVHGLFGNRAGFSGGGKGLHKGAFRQARRSLDGGVCDGTGPKGSSRRERAK
jgi:hypothetical protein